MNKCIISNLRVPAIIGIYAHEKKAPQTLVISLSFAIDVSRSAQTDSLSDAVDYAAVRLAILEFAEQSQYALLEAFSTYLAETLKKQFHLSWLKLSVTKKPVDMPDLDGVTIVIEN